MKKNYTLLVLLFLFSQGFSQQLAWLKLADFPGGDRYMPVSFSINGKGYMGLGYDTSFVPQTDLYEYDAVNNSWTQKASLPAAGRSKCISVSLDSSGLVIIGALSGGVTNEVWQYTPATNQWTQKANFPGAAREHGFGFAINGKAYAGTGYAGGNSFTDFYEFNPANNTWTTKASLPTGPRAGAVAFAINDKGYAGMGANTNSHAYYNDFYEYDPANNTWTSKTALPYIVQDPNTYHSNTSGYVLCGGIYQYTGIENNPLNLLMKYTAASDSWNLEGSFPGLPRAIAGGFAIGSDMYIAAGSQTTSGGSIIPGHTPMLHDVWKLAFIIDSLPLSIGPNNTARKESPIKIFPNPSQDYLNIASEVLSELSAIRIYDVTGKQVEELQVAADKTQLNISSLARGTYYVELVGKSKEIYSSRFVKQ